MIKEEKVLKKITINNRKKFIGIGYDIPTLRIGESFEMEIPVSILSISSRDKITAICEICESENRISYAKYNVNYNRNDKGYYSCFKCKNIEKEKTCLKKYGVKSYSMTTEFKTSESDKWRGIQKGAEKGRKTMLEKYGVSSYFQTDAMRDANRKWMSSDEFKLKSKISMMEKYGVDHYSKTQEFKNRISDNKEEIVKKIKSTFLEKYGVEWISKSEMWKDKYQDKIIETRKKIIKTCMERYGVINVSQVKSIYDKIIDTKIKRGIMIDIKDLSEWDKYKRMSRKYTSNIKSELSENWDGYDYYDQEYIKDNYDLYQSTEPEYPTIDHKISVLYGFVNNIDVSDICSIDNLCITKRSINSTKTYYIESEFLNKSNIKSI